MISAALRSQPGMLQSVSLQQFHDLTALQNSAANLLNIKQLLLHSCLRIFYWLTKPRLSKHRQYHHIISPTVDCNVLGQNGQKQEIIYTYCIYKLILILKLALSSDKRDFQMKNKPLNASTYHLLDKLQHVNNAAAHVLKRKRMSDHIFFFFFTLTSDVYRCWLQCFTKL